MRLLLTLVDPRAPASRGHRTEVAVEAPAGTLLGEVHDDLVAALGGDRSPAVTCWAADGRAVRPDHRLGEGALLQGAVLTAVVGSSPAAEEPPVGSGLVLAVRGGPDAGHHVPVRPGRLVVGRDRSGDLVLDDPGVSRRHLLLDVAPDAVRVQDAGSANGTVLISGTDAPAPLDRPGLLRAGDRLRIGSSELELREAPPPRPTRAAHGVVPVNRAPRVRTDGAGGTFRLPTAPVAPVPPKVSWAAVVVPLALSVVMAVLWSPMALLFGIAAPVLLLSTAWGERRTQRRAHTAALAAHAETCAGVRERAAAAERAVLADLEDLVPDPGAVVATVRGRLPRLWSRRPGEVDALVVRLGTGRVPAEVVLEEVDGSVATPTAEDAGTVRGDLAAAPVALSLARAGVLGLAGERAAVAGLARGLVLQLAALHSPRDLRLVVLVDEGPLAGARDWGWTRWLPHGPLLGDDPQPVGAPVGAADELLELVRERRRQRRAALGAATPPARSVVVVLVGAGSLRSRPGVAELLAHGPEVGVHALCLDEQAAALPLECGAVAALGSGDEWGLDVAADPPAWAGSTGAPPASTGEEARWAGAGGGDGGSRTRRRAVPDLVSVHTAERCARDLAPLRDATPADRRSVLPDQVRLLDLLTVDATDPAALAASWARRPRSVVVPLGVGATGPWVVDLDRDGPHVLVAGTTGAGKSELLQTLAIGLAVANRPEELSLVLVDYKGGAAFAGLVDLPHTAGVVTDLDASSTERALASLQAEVHRRERVLRRAGCRDHRDHVRRRQGGADLPALPRLVIVVDEFRVLAEELPEFLAGLVRLAAVGRSLGLHLVLATQRPAGVVGSDVRANVNLRIALRVRDEPDSTDVVECKDAAHLDPASPGRALARTGGGPLVEVQTARVGGSAPRAEHPAVRVDVLDDAGGPRVGPLATSLLAERGDTAADAPLDLDLVVAALRTAAVGLPRAPRPWLPPLAARVPVDELLDAVEATAAGPGGELLSGRPLGGGLVLGVQDLPRAQSQPPLVWRADGPLLVAGGPRSGRTGALRAVAAAAARRSPAAVHLQVVGAPGGELDDLAALAHVGAVVDRQDVERLLRLLRRTARLVRERRADPDRSRTRPGDGLDPGPGDGPSGGISGGPGGGAPVCLLLVDGADRVLADAAADVGPDGAEVTALLQVVVSDGPSVGVLAVLTGDRTLLTHKLGSAVAQRLVLAMPDPTDHVLAGIPPRDVPGHMPPGRALVLGFPDPDPVTTTDHHPASADPVEAPGAGGAGSRRPTTGLAQLALAAAVGDRTHRDAPGRVSGSTSGPPRARVWSGSIDPTALPAPTPRMPSRCDLDTTPPSPGAATAGRFLVGLGGEDVAAVHLDLADAPGALVAGPPGAGRSTLLATLGEVAARDGVAVVVVARGRSPLTAWAPGRAALVVDPDDHESLSTALRGGTGGGAGGHGRATGGHDALPREAVVHLPGLVLVDDVEGIAGTPAEEVLCRHLVALVTHRGGAGAGARGGPAPALVVAGTASELAGQFRGLVPQVRRWRTGVLLHPVGIAEGDLLGARCPRTPAGVPGRATAVVGGRTVPVQLALPGSGAAPGVTGGAAAPAPRSPARPAGAGPEEAVAVRVEDSPLLAAWRRPPGAAVPASRSPWPPDGPAPSPLVDRRPPRVAP